MNVELYFWRITDHERGHGAEVWSSTLEEFQEEQSDYTGDGQYFFLTEEDREADLKRFCKQVHELEPIVDLSYDYDKQEWNNHERRID